MSTTSGRRNSASSHSSKQPRTNREFGAPGPSIASIDFVDQGIRVSVGIPVADVPAIGVDGLTDTTFAGIERAATTVVSGEPDYDEAVRRLVPHAARGEPA